VLWLRSALRLDPRCVEAFEQLSERHMLTRAEERELLKELDVGEDAWLMDVYLARLTGDFDLDDEEEYEDGAAPPFSPGPDPSSSLAKSAAFRRLQDLHGMGSSPEVLCALANSHYSAGSISSAAAICALAHREDALCEAAVCVHVCCLVELRRAGELFYFAHQIVDSRPRSALAWFAVGSYYFLIGKSDIAQRHFSKSTRLNPRMVEAWIGFGHR
jgi:anaphase-promoting complex subunit 6